MTKIAIEGFKVLPGETETEPVPDEIKVVREFLNNYPVICRGETIPAADLDLVYFVNTEFGFNIITISPHDENELGIDIPSPLNRRVLSLNRGSKYAQLKKDRSGGSTLRSLKVGDSSGKRYYFFQIDEGQLTNSFAPELIVGKTDPRVEVEVGENTPIERINSLVFIMDRDGRFSFPEGDSMVEESHFWIVD